MKDTKEEEDHKMSDADKYQQSACTRPNRPIIHQESGDMLYGTDTANYVPKTSTQWTSVSGATPEIAEELHQTHWPHQHDGESCWNGAMERTTGASGCQCHLNISADEPPSWRRESMDNLEGTKRIRQTMQLLLVCPMTDTACSPHDLTTANGIAIDYAKHCEDTI